MAEELKYDSSVPRVRITNEDLMAMLRNKNQREIKEMEPFLIDTNQTKSQPTRESKNNHRHNEKPGFQPYHPGEGLPKKGTLRHQSNNNDGNNSKLLSLATKTNCSPPGDSRCATPLSSSSTERKNKPKRPDIPRYVPKQRAMAMKKSEETEEKTESVIETENDLSTSFSEKNEKVNCVNSPDVKAEQKGRSKSDEFTRGSRGKSGPSRNRRDYSSRTTRVNSSKSLSDLEERCKSEKEVKTTSFRNGRREGSSRNSFRGEKSEEKLPTKQKCDFMNEKIVPCGSVDNEFDDDEGVYDGGVVIVNGSGNKNYESERKNPEGTAEVIEDKPPRLDWGEEMEKNDWLRQREEQDSQFSYDMELADVESCSSPQKSLRKRNKKKKRRPKSESSTNSRSVTKSSDKRLHEKNTSSSSAISTAKTGGIIRLPSNPNRPPSAPAQSDFRNEHSTSARHLYDPKNPHQPQVVYRHVDHHRGSNNEFSRNHEPTTSTSYPGAYGEHGSILNVYPNAMTAYGYPSYPNHPDAVYYPQSPVSSVPNVDGTVNNPPKLANAQRNIHEAVILEPELVFQLSKPFPLIDQKKLAQCRWKIQLRYENAILSDVEFCTKHNIEQALWKAAFYQVIETFRKQMVDNGSHADAIRKVQLGFIEEGVIFYENLLEKLQEQYGFNLSTFLDSEAVRPHLQRHVKTALISAQKMLISLGDLARYKEQANETSNFGKARNFYLKAQQLAPKNGRPYNQLAILALYARRKLDAVYYYMRSLAASNPFLTAKEGLDLVFDEARKKYEQVEKERQEIRSQRQSKETSEKEKWRFREEIWYLPDGSLATTSDHEQVDESDEELSKLSTTDLNKKFVLSFLHAHGKLFTRIDLDNFVDVASQLLREFGFLLKQSPLPLSNARLLQLMAMNMYTVQHTEVKGIEPNCSGLLQVHALQLSFEMLSAMLDRSINLLREEMKWRENGDCALSYDLQQVLPAIKVWCDWLMCHPNTWNNPRPTQSDYRTSGEPDAWTLLAEFFSLTKQLDRSGIVTSKDPNEGWEAVTLPEDTALAGFVPLLSLPQEITYVTSQDALDKENVRNVIRLRRFRFCAEYLCGIIPPVLRYSAPDQTYKSVLTESSSDYSEPERNNDAPSPLDSSVGSGDEKMVDEKSARCDLRNASSRAEIEELRNRKLELTRRKADQERHRQQVQEVLSETSLSRTQLEIRPHYLIPDTNCFIDHLANIKKLVRTGQFQLTVPLVVVNELEGLGKGGRSDQWHCESHNKKVVNGAKEALEFLEGIFSVRNSHVRSVTAQGNEMDTISFRSEAASVGSNDDIILHCCTQYCSEKYGGQKTQNKDGVTRVTRKVVLLTDDRALRVKALNQDVPVRDIPRFLHKMHIS